MEEVDFFRTNGYLIIPGAISGEALARTQSAYDRVTAPLVEQPREGSADGLHLVGGEQQKSSGSSDAPRAHYSQCLSKASAWGTPAPKVVRDVTPARQNGVAANKMASGIAVPHP